MQVSLERRTSVLCAALFRSNRVRDSVGASNRTVVRNWLQRLHSSWPESSRDGVAVGCYIIKALPLSLIETFVPKLDCLCVPEIL